MHILGEGLILVDALAERFGLGPAEHPYLDPNNMPLVWRGPDLFRLRYYDLVRDLSEALPFLRLPSSSPCLPLSLRARLQIGFDRLHSPKSS